jgi:hypothetical protein
MNTAPWLEIQQIKAATIDEFAAIQVIRDIDDAVARRDVVMLRQFAAEAARSGMDQESSRAFEIADVIESKATTSARDELLRIKAALEPRQPSQADLVRRYDAEQLAAAAARSAPFDVNTYEADEARRAEAQNAQLARANRRAEEQRAAQAARDAEPKGPGRR